MVKIVLKIEGMACGMCESHINNAIRSKLPVKKVTSSHTQGETVIIAEHPIDKDTLQKIIEETGYTLLETDCRPYEKKGLFHLKK